MRVIKQKTNVTVVERDRRNKPVALGAFVLAYFFLLGVVFFS